MRRLPPVLLVPLAAGLWALGSELMEPDTAQAQREYTLEQNKIDLALAEIALQASSGEIPGEEAQAKIDEWVRANAGRLTEQAERAARLDEAAPLSADPPSTAARDPDASPEDRRLAELDAVQNQKVEELRGKATNGEHLQALIDEWAHEPEGKAILDERIAIFSEMSRANPLGSHPIVVAVSDDAPPAEVATLDIQERIARRIQDIRSRHPNADGEEFQFLIDQAKADFEQDFDEIAELMKQARHARLSATVEKLRTDVSSAAAQPVPGK